VAERVGKSRAAVTNTLRLLELPEGVKRLLGSGALSAGQGRAILSAATDSDREQLAAEALRKGWSVREIEARARTLASTIRGRSGRRRGAPMKNASHYEEQLQILYGTRVHIRDRGGRGELVFEFYTAADRDRLVHQLLTDGATADELVAGNTTAKAAVD
jgi:ParB family chromosome partitioning protein